MFLIIACHFRSQNPSQSLLPIAHGAADGLCICVPALNICAIRAMISGDCMFIGCPTSMNMSSFSSRTSAMYEFGISI